MVSKKKLTDKSVYVYRNLHMNTWSIRSRKTGKILEHRTTVYLSDPQFRVGEKSRQRVLTTHTKNVHAGVAGELIDDDDCLIQEYATLASMPIYYDPVKNSKFVDSDNNPVDSAAFAKMDIAFVEKVRAWDVKKENDK